MKFRKDRNAEDLLNLKRRLADLEKSITEMINHSDEQNVPSREATLDTLDTLQKMMHSIDRLNVENNMNL